MFANALHRFTLSRSLMAVTQRRHQSVVSLHRNRGQIPCPEWWHPLDAHKETELYAYGSSWTQKGESYLVRSRDQLGVELRQMPGIPPEWLVGNDLEEWTRHLISPETGSHVYLLGVRVESVEMVKAFLPSIEPDAVAVESDHLRFPAANRETFGQSDGENEPSEYVHAHDIVNQIRYTSFWLIDHPSGWTLWLRNRPLREKLMKHLPHRLEPQESLSTHPAAVRHLTEQRNANMVLALRNIPGEVVVGIVGASHLKEIEDVWHKSEGELISLLPPVVDYSLDELEEFKKEQKYARYKRATLYVVVSSDTATGIIMLSATLKRAHLQRLPNVAPKRCLSGSLASNRHNLRHFDFPISDLEYAQKHLSPGVGKMTNLEIEKGRGAWVWTTDGKKYLDLTSGIGVTNTGHCHPKIVQAAQDQVAKMIHAQVNIVYHRPMLDLIKRLETIMPAGLDRFFFWNSGSEAVEAAVKLARHYTKKQNIISFKGGYHGRTFGAMALTTSKTIYRAGYGPLMGGVFHTPYPYCKQCPVSIATDGKYNVDNCCNNPLLELEQLFKMGSAPSETAAVIIEPVLGEGGYVTPPQGFLKALKDLCHKNNVLLIADEVQSGFGRTGKFFAVEHYDVVPDILIFAKGIASGFPLSGIASTYDIMASQPAGSMGGTYAGNAVSCAVACATIDAMKEEKMLENTQIRGEQLMSGLRSLQKKYDVISDVRGLGLMVGVEFNPKKTDVTKIADAISKECYNRNMLLLTTSIFETLRFIPPLNVTGEEIDTALDIFERSLETVLHKGKATGEGAKVVEPRASD
ncbi:hypothetical protein PROFUN_02510 [Planoprotostelium fungivorum]|uniref:4-aminobutyrate aminotransferase n=1 Tax=Planoprotostelium fungivorum TaxID=1890364 RepID=A0A2P6MP71_9EUKA|nr:hypothetical protein PROFUN_02510 [Planoprotostelium fungivorum]